MSATPHRCFSRQTLEAFQIGRLAPERVAAVGAEIEVCASCCQALEELDSLEDPMTSALRELGRSGRNAPEIPPSWGEATVSLDSSESKPSSTAAELFDSPRVLGQYQLEKLIGRGGMGAVWKATHRSLKRPRAVKLLPVNRLADREAVARFAREMEAAGRLIHPHLVQAHDAGEIAGQPYLAMELLEGSDISELVRRQGALSVPEACEVVRQAALGLAHAHAHHSVHRDVKPSNLFLTHDGNVKVLDLGLALLLDVPTETNVTTCDRQLLGTLAYMSPEQFRSPRTVGPATDVYALGCTLYFLLKGEPPFADRLAHGAIDMAITHATQTVPPIAADRTDVPQSLAALLDRMLAKRPEDRPSDMTEVANRIAQFCSGGIEKLVDRLRSCEGAEVASAEATTDPRSHGDRRTTPAIWTAAAIVACMIFPVGLSAWLVADRGQATRTDDGAQSAPLADGPGRAAAASDAAVQLALERMELDPAVRDAAATVVRQHPKAGRWSGRSGDTLFAIRIVSLPEGAGGAAALPASLSRATTGAASDLLQTKSLLTRYSDVGLDDATTLREAFVRAAGDTNVRGRVEGLAQHARAEEGIAVALVSAKERSIEAGMSTEATTGIVRSAYRDVMHERSRELMAGGKWNDALLLWKHLHSRKLVSAELYLDAARCFHELGQDQDALRILDETLDLFAGQARWELLEQAGDLASELEGEAAKRTSHRAYELALQRFEIRTP